LQHHYGQIIQQAGGNVEVGVGGMVDLPKSVSGKMQALSREARSNQRRLLTAFGTDTDSDLLKFNQLKVRCMYKLLFTLKILLLLCC
jgi:histone-lysine N-methyltransferase SETD1